MSDKGGIEFEFPLIPSEDELRQMRKEQTREKLYIIDESTIDMKEHLSRKGWNKVTIATIPSSDPQNAEEHEEIDLAEFHFSHFALQGSGVLLKDTEEVVVFQSNYNVMGHLIGANDSYRFGHREDEECTITITNFIE